MPIYASGTEAFPSLSSTYGSPNSLAQKIHEIEKQMAQGKLVLCYDDGKSLKPYSHTQEDAPFRNVVSDDVNANVGPIGGVDILVGTKLVSYANMFNDNATKPNVNFRTLKSDVPNEADFDVKNPIASVEEVHVWIKFHDVPFVAYMEDVLRIIATKLVTPLMLDSYTNDMCLESWGRSSYARAMVEIDAHNELIDTLVVVVPELNDNGYMRETIRCEKHGANRQQNEKTIGFKPKSKLVYRHVSNRGGSASTKHSNMNLTSNVGDKTNEASTSKHNTNNDASSSSNKGSGKFDDTGNVEIKSGETLIEDSKSHMEVTYDESAQFMASKDRKEVAVLEIKAYMNNGRNHDSMADLNIPADIAPAEQAPAVAPPTRTDDQILPSSKWVPIGKRNSVLDVQKSQRNPIFSIVVAILKNTNFLASSTIPAIYIQQFWDTIDALGITPANDNNPFEAPPSSDTIIEYVNTLGYPSTLRNVFAMSVNALYQPWRAIMSMINMCLTGITHYSNIDYAERIWEEFVQSIQTFLTDRKNLATKARGKKKTLHLLIPNVRFVGKDGREVFGMPIPDALLTDEITSAPYYSRYLEHVAEYQRCLDEEHAKQTKPSTPKASKVTTPPKPTPTTTEPSKKDQSKKRKLVKKTSDAPSPVKRSKASKVTKQRNPKSPLQLVDEFVDEGVPEQEPVYGDEEADIQRAMELSIKEQEERTQGPARPVVIREPDSGRIQPLPDVQGNGKEKRHTPTTTEPSGHAESHSLYAKLGLTDSETESDEEVSPEINAGTQDEGQTGPNPESQPQLSHAVHAGPNLEHMDFEENLKLPTEDQVRLEEPASSAGTLSSLQNLDKELSFTNQFLVEKSQEDEPDKSNTEVEVQSMVMVPIHQDTSSVPLMTTSVIDLTMSQPVSTTV
ncbi:retrovirus-related pol polyprotein from transposon TNT 1-94 [Tanacetum coccineum]